MKISHAGSRAEQAVSDDLRRRGYKIIARNWKTKVCEIDVIAKKDDIIHFVEVKYRGSPAQGSGLEYIGHQKLQRLNFAARVWVQANGWEGDYRLLAADVAGIDFEKIKILEIN